MAHIEHDYLSSEIADKLPDNAANGRQQEDRSSALSTCANETAILGSLIEQAFLHRRLFSNEIYTVVTLRNDATADDFRPQLKLTTCSITYDIDLGQFV